MVQWDPAELDRTSGVPLYVQIADSILNLVETHQLARGQKLPPSRELAQKLGLNRNTVTSAYDELARRGIVHSHVGRGTFVVTRHTDVPTGLEYRFSRAVEAASERVRLPSTPTTHPDPIDFASLVPDEELFPVEPFRDVLDDVLSREGKTLLQYGPAAGHPPLRDYIAGRLRGLGVSADATNVLIVNGSQQGLDLICRALLDPGDRVALESPTYTSVLPMLAQYLAEIDEVPMTDGGMDLEVLSSVLSRNRPKFVFTMPTFHNPTGISMDLERRERLIELGARHGVVIVEDDFDSEIRFDGEPIPSLKALDSADGVIHIGTFSKGLFPGLRLGWIVSPRKVVEALGRSKLISDYHTSLLLQAAVLEFCRRGLYDDHLERLTAIYRRKSRKLVRALERSFPRSVRWTRPEGGYSFWVTLPPGASAERLLVESAPAGVLFTPGGHFFARGGGARFFRLSISKVPIDRIDEGIEKLGALLRRQLERLSTEESSGARAITHEPALHI